MKELRLLERIALSADETSRTHATSTHQLIQSILNHLACILNTRQGSVPIDLKFGVPDFTNLAGSVVSGTTREIIESIEKMIASYEPRLKKPQVKLVEDEKSLLSLSFSINGFIEVDNQDIPIQLSSKVLSNGKITISDRE